MMSKNSFLVRLIENARRRSWLPVLCMVVLLAMYPLRLLAEISNKLNQYYPYFEVIWHAKHGHAFGDLCACRSLRTAGIFVSVSQT